MNPAQILLVVAGFLYVLLGTSHGALVLRDLAQPRTFTPTDTSVREAMQGADVAIAPHSNLWRAWLGFNITHSMGLLLFAGLLLALGLDSDLTGGMLLTSVATLVAATYLVVSWRFFFNIPTSIAGIALASIVTSWALP